MHLSIDMMEPSSSENPDNANFEEDMGVRWSKLGARLQRRGWISSGSSDLSDSDSNSSADFGLQVHHGDEGPFAICVLTWHDFARNPRLTNSCTVHIVSWK